MKGKLRGNLFTVIISVLIIAGFAGYVFGKDGEFSPSENRYLAKRPAVSFSALADGSFMKNFELYTEEQLPFRDALIRLKSLAGTVMLKNENNGIVLGKEGFLFEKLVKTDEQLGKNRAAVNGFVKQAERDINICIVPNSYEILRDLTPAGFPGISQKEYIDSFYGSLEGFDNVKTIDMFPVLTEHEDEYIYYRTDHHWTTQGAYYGYTALCDSLGLDPVDVSDLSDIKKDVPGFLGTYYSKYKGPGAKEDILTYYEIPVAAYEAGGKSHDSLYDTDKLAVYDKYAMFMHGNEGLSKVSAIDDDRDRRDELILFKDSYSNCLIPFLTYNYKNIIVVDLRYYAEPVSELLKSHPDADILLMYNFMHFNEDNHFYRLTG